MTRILEEFETLEKTFCHSNFNENLVAEAGVKNSQSKSNNT